MNKAVCVMVFGSKGGFLAVTRRDRPSEFVFPGGKIDEGESAVDAAVREVFEETGVRIDPNFLSVLSVGEDGYGYDVTAFMYGKVVDVESACQCEAGIEVDWVSAHALINGPFGTYNAELFAKLIY